MRRVEGSGNGQEARTHLATLADPARQGNPSIREVVYAGAALAAASAGLGAHAVVGAGAPVTVPVLGGDGTVGGRQVCYKIT